MSRRAGDTPGAGVSRRRALAAGGIAAMVLSLAGRAKSAGADAPLIDAVGELRRLRDELRDLDKRAASTQRLNCNSPEIEEQEALGAELSDQFEDVAARIARINATSVAALSMKASALQITTDFYCGRRPGEPIEEHLEIEQLMGWTLADDIVRLLS